MDLFYEFDALLSVYSKKIPNKVINASIRADILRNMESFPGVYVIIHDKEIIYIGSSGKVDRSLKLSASTVKSRLTNSYTPYTISDDKFKFSPSGKIKGSNRPEGYTHEIALSKLTLLVFDLTPNNNQVIAPSTLEHILIQSFMNQYKKLPKANQKI